MKLKHPFKTETRWLFFDSQYTCGECGGNGQDCGGTELHHIVGRKSSSPYNAITLCKGCHAKVGHTDKEQRKYIEQTIEYLSRNHYEPTEQDKQFLKEYYD